MVRIPGNIRSAVARVDWRKMALRAIYFLDVALPKRRDLVVVHGWPDGEDQSSALVNALARMDRNVVLLTNGDPPQVSDGIRRVRLHSLRGVLVYLRGAQLYFTHGLFGSFKPARGRIVVNLWHGMPIKRIGVSASRQITHASVTLSTAESYVPVLCQAWSMRPSQVLVTGLPRNDVLVEAARVHRANWDEPVVAWLPTFRQSCRGEASTDGVDSGSPFQFADATPAVVERLFRDLNMSCWVKTHPMARSASPQQSTHLTILPQSWNGSLYERLGGADILISDFSSVWIDFLLTERPLIFAISDLDDYEETRGTYMNDIPGLTLPGPVVTTMTELRDELARLRAGDDQFQDHRRAVRELLHKFSDSQNAHRVVEAVDSLSRRTRKRGA